MGRKRRSYSAEFKAMVGLEALRGIETSNELARKYEVHPGLITDWKKEVRERAAELFKKKSDIELQEIARERDRLQKKVGELTMDVDFLKKKCVQLGLPID